MNGLEATSVSKLDYHQNKRYIKSVLTNFSVLSYKLAML